MHQNIYFVLLLLFVGFQTGISSRCRRGTFEVHTINKTNAFCDDCGTKDILTPCATVRCGGENPECKLIYQSSTDIADCAYGKVPLRPACRPRCPEDVEGKPIKCPRGSVIIQDIGGCRKCYKPDLNDSSSNPCKAADACPKSQTCSLLEVVCVKSPCYPVKQCCPRDVCLKNALRYTDSNGCHRCYVCNECVTKQCGAFQKCILEEVQCKNCPCPPRARCVSIFT